MGGREGGGVSAILLLGGGGVGGGGGGREGGLSVMRVVCLFVSCLSTPIGSGTSGSSCMSEKGGEGDRWA